MSSASAVSLSGDQFNFLPKFPVKSHVGADGHDAGIVVVPDAQLLFGGDYKRAGNDLVLSSQDHKYVVSDYFKGEKRPTLASTDGATLTGDVVSALTGHVQYAQAGAAASVEIIGHVMKMTGSASVVRNGVSIVLNVGDAVQKGDVIQTGSDSSIGLTLIDGTAFAMASSARMVLNEMIYDPSGSSNSSLISLVQGTITFVAGATAKNGNMRVDTPVATMGIRGTAVLVEISADNGPTKFSVLLEPDGHTGSFNIYDKTTGQLIGTVSQAGQVTFVSAAGVGLPAVATEQAKTAFDLQLEKSIIQDAFKLYFPNYNPDANPKATDHPRTDIGVPQNTVVKNGFDANGRPTITYTTTYLNPDTNTKTTVQVVHLNTPPSFKVKNVGDTQLPQASLPVPPHSFYLGDKVTITDPDIGVAPFMDVAIPYVTGTGEITSATGPSSIVFGGYLIDQLRLKLNPATGLVTYDPEKFRFLGDGETAVYTFKFKSASGVGSSGSDSAALTLTLTVTGENDAPTIVPNVVGDPPVTIVTGGVKEEDASTLETSGKITFQDFDLTDGHGATFVEQAHSGSYLGTFTITKLPEDLTDTSDTGTVNWHFSLSNSNTTLQSLAEGQTLKQYYIITITDIHGLFVQQTVEVDIVGTNDLPVFTSEDLVGGITETIGTPAPLSELTDSGVIEFTDIDLIDQHAVSTVGTYVPSALHPLALGSLTAVLNSDTVNGVGGKVTWTYTVDPKDIEYLAAGDTLTEEFTITINDGTSTPITKTISVTITGTNDAPVLTAAALNAVLEDDTAPVGATVADLFPTGTGFIDVDQGASLKGIAIAGYAADSAKGEWQYDDGSGWQSIGVVSMASALVLAAGTSLRFLPAPDFNGEAPSLTVYGIDDSMTVLPVTLDLTDTQYHLPNSAVAQSSTEITTSVTSVNDAPDTADNLVGISEDGLHTFQVSDFSFSDTHDGPANAFTALKIVTLPSSGELYLDNLLITASTSINYADITKLVYKPAPDASGTASFTFQVQDDGGISNGGVDTSASHTFTFDIAPVADAPAITIATVPAVDEDHAIAVPITVAVTDTDLSETILAQVLSGIPAGFALTDGLHVASSTGIASAIDVTGWSLADLVITPAADWNGTFTLTLAATSSDTATYSDLSPHSDTAIDSQSVEITVNPVNDAAIIGNPTVSEVREGEIDASGNLVATGGISISDVDSAESFQIAVDSDPGNFGSLTLAVNGQYTYTVDNAAVQSLDGTQVHTDTFTIKAFDGTTQNVIFTTLGVNEILATGVDETLMATVGRDNFVFAPSSGHDTVMDFTSGSDKIDFKAFAGINSLALTNLLNAADYTGGDTLLYINGTTDTLLVKNAVLHSADFILHA